MSTISDLAKAAAGRCWDGYEPVPGKDAYSDDSCRKVGSKKKKKSEKKANLAKLPILGGLATGIGNSLLRTPTVKPTERGLTADDRSILALERLGRGAATGASATTGAMLGSYPGLFAANRLRNAGKGKLGLLAALSGILGGGILGGKGAQKLMGPTLQERARKSGYTSIKQSDDCHCYPGGPADPDKKGCKDPDCDHCDKEASAIRELAKAAASAAWQRKAGKNSKGGLNEKGRKSYEKENPGSDLKAPVTGKVKPGGKAAKRRKSFCARMSGNKGPMKKPNGEPTRKALSLRKWKC